jgi:membrane protein YdbS with pleckstrin-like domain
MKPSISIPLGLSLMGTPFLGVAGFVLSARAFVQWYFVAWAFCALIIVLAFAYVAVDPSRWQRWCLGLLSSFAAIGCLALAIGAISQHFGMGE